MLDHAAPNGQSVNSSHIKAAGAQSRLMIRASAPSSAVYILLGAGGLMMIVGFFGCFGAVRESQCLLASVKRIINVIILGFFFLHSYCFIIRFPLCFAVLCLPSDNIWSRDCCWCVWIYEQRAGTLL